MNDLGLNLLLFCDLIVEGQDVINVTDAQKATGEKVNHCGDIFAEIKSMAAEWTDKDQQHPGEVVIVRSVGISPIGFVRHRGNQDNVDQPSDKEQATGEEPQCTRQWLSEEEPVGARESDDPKKIADQRRVIWRNHGRLAAG